MQVRILHDGWTIDGKPRAEGAVMETSNPAAVAHALGLVSLSKPRRKAGRQYVEGDFRAAEPVGGSEPTDTERSAAEGFAAAQGKSLPRGRMSFESRPLRVTLDDASVERLASAVKGEAIPAVTEPVRTIRGRRARQS